jgi:hypothetical protein
MKLLFSSSHLGELELVGTKLGEHHIPYKVRYDPPSENATPLPPYAELWVQNDSDAPRAMKLYLSLFKTSPIFLQLNYRNRFQPRSG